MECDYCRINGRLLVHRVACCLQGITTADSRRVQRSVDKDIVFYEVLLKKNITTVIKVISVFIVSQDFKNIGPLSCACSCLLLYPASVYWDDDGQHCEPSALSRKMREGEFLCVCWQLVPLCLSHFSPSLSVCSPSACSCVCVRVCL